MEKEQVSSAPTQIASPQPASIAIRPSASNLISAVIGVHLSGRCLRLQWDSLSPFVACDWDSQPLSVFFNIAESKHIDLVFCVFSFFVSGVYSS